MNKTISLLLVASLFIASTSAGQTTIHLKQVVTLEIPGDGGSNGAGVVWHPIQQKYYAPMAGNVDYPIGIFDAKGKLLSTEEQKTSFDIRGFWYNPKTKTLQMNGYSEFGWAEYKLNAKGFPIDTIVFHHNKHQPDAQSVGAFNPKENVVYFFDEDGNLDKYDFTKASFVETIELTLGKTKDDDPDDGDNYDVLEDYNSTTVIYTGISGAEIGLLNHYDQNIELYNIKTGHLNRKLSLPEDAPAEERLNFSFSNGIYWLFDKDSRAWKGYK